MQLRRTEFGLASLMTGTPRWPRSYGWKKKIPSRLIWGIVMSPPQHHYEAY
jgi:hypothetical protein